MKELDLESYKESLEIVRTGKDRKGNSFNGIGQLNQAAWIGENSKPLIDEIERLREMKKLLFLANETSWEIRDAQTQRTLASSKFDRDLLHGLRELGKSLGFTVNAGILRKEKS